MTSLRLLIVEDSPDDAELVVEELISGGFQVDWERVDTPERLVTALEERSWDIVISDFAMPRFDGLRAFEILRKGAFDIPFIFVSGAIGEERAVEAMRAGARDYVIKGNLTRLNAVVRRELDEWKRRRHHREAERARELAARRYQDIFETAAVALLETDMSGSGPFRIVDANPMAVALLEGTSREEVLGPMSRFLVDANEAHARSLEVRGRSQGATQFEAVVRSLGGREKHVLVTLRMPDDPSDAAHVVVSLADITARRELEDELRAAQRMEAVGRLAGGVAHDFNNLLTIIGSYAGFLSEALAADDAAREDVDVIVQTVQKASELTKQLLAFSRRQVLRPEPMQINDVIAELARMLPRVLGEDVCLKSSLATELPLIHADRTHLEQVVMNLVINARDAMGHGGTLTIETAHVQAGPATVADVAPGEYVVLSVTDTGSGMDAETQTRIFEPFFTTKELGKGTGLGLSTVYGIVKQSHGHVRVRSVIGEGTCFDVFLPSIAGGSARQPSTPARATTLHGTEVILVVEDERLVLGAIQRTLRAAGYTVLSASGPEAALSLAAQRGGEIDLVVTDLVMPGMNGQELALRLIGDRPGTRILFMSGYTDDSLTQSGALDAGVDLLEKPFRSDELLRRVREALDRPAG